MNYDHNKKFGLLKFHSGYGKFNLNSPKGYSLKIINAHTAVYCGIKHAKHVRVLDIYAIVKIEDMFKERML